MEDRPEQPPEGKLIADAAGRMNLSIREAARRAGISYGRWRQITAGYQNVSPGSYAAVHAPAQTLARMAAVVGVTPDELTAAGREDAAKELDEITRRAPVAAVPDAPGEADVISLMERMVYVRADPLEVKVWETEGFSKAERARVIVALWEKDGDFAARLAGEARGSGTGLAGVT